MAVKQLNMGNVLMTLYATERKKTFNPMRFVPRPYQRDLDKLIEEGKIEYAEEYVSLEKEAKQWEREKTQQQQ